MSVASCMSLCADTWHDSAQTMPLRACIATLDEGFHVLSCLGDTCLSWLWVLGWDMNE